MMTIEEETQHLVDFLSHPCGFEASVYAMIQIRPISEDSPPSEWEVSWKEIEVIVDENIEGVTEMDRFKEFSSVQEAAQFFVEKRRYLCLGADFESILMGSSHQTVEIEE